MKSFDRKIVIMFNLEWMENMDIVDNRIIIGCIKYLDLFLQK